MSEGHLYKILQTPATRGRLLYIHVCSIESHFALHIIDDKMHKFTFSFDKIRLILVESP